MIMKPLLKILRSRAALHVYFWGFYFGLLSFEPRQADQSTSFILLRNVFMLCTLAVPVYIHFHLFERYFGSRKYGNYAFLAIANVVVFGLVNRSLYAKYLGMPMPAHMTILYVAMLVAVTTAIKLAKAGYEQRATLQAIRAKHLHTELELLKSQINPHFLFNALNNLFGMVKRVDERSAKGIATLSHLMRYMIHETNVDRIELQREIEQIERLIELQRLRFSDDDNISIEFNVSGTATDVKLPPMLLVPFVENAFKHGISLSSPSYIHIDVDRAGGSLVFAVKNSDHAKSGSSANSSSGIGLQNVKRRLELLFPGTHDLQISTDGGDFAVTLRIPLQESEA
jgi:sensor histidine kinase YesM